MPRTPHLRSMVSLGAGLEIVIRRAGLADAGAIRALYDSVYGPAYPLTIIRDPTRTARALRSPHVFWIVGERSGTIVSTVVFEIDPTDRIGKVFGAVVRPDHRGHNLTALAIRAGMRVLVDPDAPDSPLDLVYATTRTLSPAPERLVRSLGFVNLGVFPNVHRVERTETHGLDVYFRADALASRRRSPRLVPELVDFYAIARRVLSLPDPPAIEDIPWPTRLPHRPELEVVADERAVGRLYARRLAERCLKFSFFPFHEPHRLLRTADGAREVFLHVNPHDRYACVVGIRGPTEAFGGLLEAIGLAGERMGLCYVELLVSAFDPRRQRQALAARFLPCAYFPAMKVTTGTARMDYIVFSRSFERLDFTDIHLEGTGQEYLQGFMRCWYRMLLRHGDYPLQR